jgi:hypothetical protein
MPSRTYVLLLLLVSPSVFGCDPSGAFGIQFGSKVGFWARSSTDPQLPGPWHKAWSVKAPKPDPRFDRYLVRALEEDKAIYEIIGLRTIDPPLASSEDYATRLEPATHALMELLEREKGIAFHSSMRGWYSAEDEQLEYEVRHHRDVATDYIMVGCTHKELKSASVRKSVKAYLDCEDKAKSTVNNCLKTGSP